MGLTKDSFKNIVTPLMPIGANECVMQAVSADEEKNSVAVTFTKHGYRRVVAVFYMDKAWPMQKLAQLFQCIGIEVDHDIDDPQEVADLLEEFVGKKVSFVYIKHREIAQRDRETNKYTGNKVRIASFWYAHPEKLPHDPSKAEVTIPDEEWNEIMKQVEKQQATA